MADQVQIRIEQTGPATSRAVVRGHQVSVDRPLQRGGEDRGPMGGELILVGLGGCFTSNLLAAIRARLAPQETPADPSGLFGDGDTGGAA